MRQGLWTMFVMALIAIGGGGAAEAQGYSAEQQALCTDDAFRLCSSAIPDVDRVTACMVQKQAQLSPGCAQFFRKPEAQVTPVSTRKPAAKRTKARKTSRSSAK